MESQKRNFQKRKEIFKRNKMDVSCQNIKK